MKGKVFALCILLLLLSGCVMAGGEELLRAPKPSEDYVELQGYISKYLDDGYTYSAPTAGANHQPIQMSDLDGDGTDEALIFLSKEGEPIRIYIYTKRDDVYTEVCYFENDSEYVDSAQYSDLDGDGRREIIVGWKTSGLKSLSVYRYDGYTVATELSCEYNVCLIADMTGNGIDNLVIIRHDPANLTGVTELYGLQNGDFALLSGAELSVGVEKVTRVITGRLSDGKLAVFVASQIVKDATVTDIIVLRENELVNITCDPEKQVSADTIRIYKINAADINGDGFVEIPRPIALPPYSADTLDAGYWYVEWLAYHSDGSCKPVLYTFHNQNDGWYLELPESWVGRMTVVRRDTVPGERSIVFALLSTNFQPPVDLMILHSSANKSNTASAERILAGQYGDMTVTASFPKVPNAYAEYVPPSDMLPAMLKWIRSDWITGETS